MSQLYPNRLVGDCSRAIRTARTATRAGTHTLSMTAASSGS